MWSDQQEYFGMLCLYSRQSRDSLISVDTLYLLKILCSLDFPRPDFISILTLWYLIQAPINSQQAMHLLSYGSPGFATSQSITIRPIIGYLMRLQMSTRMKDASLVFFNLFQSMALAHCLDTVRNRRWNKSRNLGITHVHFCGWFFPVDKPYNDISKTHRCCDPYQLPRNILANLLNREWAFELFC